MLQSSLERRPRFIIYLVIRFGWNKFVEFIHPYNAFFIPSLHFYQSYTLKYRLK